MCRLYKTYLTSLIFNFKKMLKVENGTVVITFAVALIPIIAALGIALDTSRAYQADAVLAGVVDAAALAGAKQGSNADITTEAKRIFNASLPSNLSVVDGPTVTITQENKLVTVKATVRIPTIFMKIFGKMYLDVTERSTVEKNSIGLEVALVMDNTGSMAGDSMTKMLAAANTLVDTLYGDKDTIDGLWVGLVPYSTAVNVNGRTNWLTSTGKTLVTNTDYFPNVTGGKWAGCIEENATFDRTDNINPVGLFTPFLYRSTLFHDYGGNTPPNWVPVTTADTQKYGSSKVTIPGDNDWQKGGTGISGRTFGKYYAGSGGSDSAVGPNLGCPMPMLELTASKATVKSQISNMKATYRGGTMTNVGLVWGWRMISPTWLGKWHTGALANKLPQAYGKTNKAIVILTDGVNQWNDWTGGFPGPLNTTTYPRAAETKFTNDSNLQKDADYTGFGRLRDNRLGVGVSNSQANTELNKRMTTICTAIKAQGITIYTITLNLTNQTTMNLFKNCASKPEYYFNSPTASSLQDIFKQIGTSLSDLRLRWPKTVGTDGN